jgi:glycerol-3-phosphate dehydrogenase (NAD(P)+)
MANVTILGAGLMGTAVAWPLSDNGHAIRLVGTHLDGAIIRSCLDTGYHPKLRRPLPPRVRPYFVEQLPEALAGADADRSTISAGGATG